MNMKDNRCELVATRMRIVSTMRPTEGRSYNGGMEGASRYAVSEKDDYGTAISKQLKASYSEAACLIDNHVARST